MAATSGGQSRTLDHNLYIRLEPWEVSRSSATRDAVHAGTRFLIYTLAIAAVLFLFLLAIRKLGFPNVIVENGPLENTQLILLGATSWMLLVTARRTAANGRRSAFVFYFMAILVWPLLVRELDSAFKILMNTVWWKIALSMTLIMASVYAVRRRHVIVQQIPRLLPSRSFGLFFAAFISVMVTSRLLGQQVVWEGALAESYDRQVPRAVEELGELVGYLAMLFGSVEAWFEARAVRRGDHTPNGSSS